MRLSERIPAGILIAVDTSVLIYAIEEHEVLAPVAGWILRDALAGRRNPGCASVLALAEVLVRPLRSGRQDLVERYTAILTGAAELRLVNVDPDVAARAAALRAARGLRLPDAIHIATAQVAGATQFITNDGRIPSIPDLDVVVISDHMI